MFKQIRIGMSVAVAVIMILTVSLTGCSSTAGNPLLPSGFVESTVPDVSLGGYIYINQDSPVVITPDFLPVKFDDISVDCLQVWAGPDYNSYGGLVRFQNQADAARVLKLSSQVTLPVWTMNNGKIIYAVNNASGDWNIALKNIIIRQKMIDAAVKYPEVKNDFAFFPAHPPVKPFAAGFIDVNSTLAESLAKALNISVTSYVSALKTAGVSRVCFVGYGSQTVAISSKSFTLEYFNSLKLCGLALGRSAYPDAAITLVFDKVMIDAGLEKSTVNDVDIYTYAADGIIVLVAHKGNIIYAAVAQSQETAQALLLSCF